MEELESLGEILVAEDNEGLLFLIKKYWKDMDIKLILY